MAALLALKLTIIWICFHKMGAIAAVYSKITNESEKATLRTFFILYIITLVIFLIIS